MEKYIGVKIIEAEPCKAWKQSGEWGVGADGYKIRYEDGYESWSPQRVFEEAYRSIGGMTFGLAIEAMRLGKKVARSGWNGKGIYIGIQKGFDLEAAAAASHASWMKQKLEQGFTSRKAEDGEELMVLYADLSEKQKEMDRAYVRLDDAMTSDFIYIDTTGLETDNQHAPKSRVPWLASQTDMLSTDWVVVE